MIYIFLVLIGCQDTAENYAKSWIRSHNPTAPISGLTCEADQYAVDGRVNCVVKIEEVGRIFTYKLKCYNSNKLAHFKNGCIEALDD